MTRKEASDTILAIVRTILGMLPAEDWQPVARDVAVRLMRLSGEQRSPSGMYRIPAPSDDEEPTKP